MTKRIQNFLNLAIVFGAAAALYPNMIDMTQPQKIRGDTLLPVGQYLLAELFFGCAAGSILQLVDISKYERNRKMKGPQP